MLVKQLGMAGYLGPPGLSLCQVQDHDVPMCEACKYGKQTRRPDHTTITTKNPDTTGGLKEGITIPGEQSYSG